MHTILERGWLTGHQKAGGLCRHIWKYFDALWTFIRIDGVEPTNNTAERKLRGGVIKRKLSFGVQSESGREFLERTMSVIATCRQRGIDELAYLTACIQAHYAGNPAPNLLEWA
jgi:transposase